MRYLLAFVLVLLAAGATSAGPAPDGEKAVRGACEWIARQAVITGEERPAAAFPEYAEVPDERSLNLYNGSAGVLLFLENAAEALDDDGLRRLATWTATGLADSVAKSPPKGKGLYVGVEGIAHAFLVRARIRSDEGAMAKAVELAEMALEREQAEPNTTNDIIGGLAGTILVFLEVGEATGQERFVRAAADLAKVLIDRAEKEEADEPRLWWPVRVGWPRHYPNFSHGTAGVAYALARVARATKDEAARDAAIAGANWLVAHGTMPDGTLACYHYAPGHEDYRMEGWCHGPAGTGRLFLLLSSLTKDERWMKAARASAAWVMKTKPDPGREGGRTRFYSPSLCCGAAGVIDFFVDMYRATGAKEYRDYALGAGRYLIGIAKPDGEGIKWTNYDRPDEEGVIYHGVSLMLGASGEALALLRLAAIDEPLDPVRHLPDRLTGDGRVVPGSGAEEPESGESEAPPPGFSLTVSARWARGRSSGSAQSEGAAPSAPIIEGNAIREGEG